MRVLIGIDPHLRPPTPSRPSTNVESCSSTPFSPPTGPVCARLRDGANVSRSAAGRWKVPEGWDAPSPSLRLVAAGEMVIDVVPAKLSSRARLLATGNARKNDRVDAFHVALAALGGERLAEVDEEEQAEVLRMLSERREDLIKERTRTLNRLHGLLRDLLAGAAPKNLSAEKAARVLRGVRPRSAPARTRRRLAADLLRDVRRLDRQLCELEWRIREVQSKRPPRA